MPSLRRTAALCFLAGFLLAAATQAADQPLPQGITAEALAKDNNLFLTVAKKALHWEEPAEPWDLSISSAPGASASSSSPLLRATS